MNCPWCNEKMEKMEEAVRQPQMDYCYCVACGMTVMHHADGTTILNDPDEKGLIHLSNGHLWCGRKEDCGVSA